MLGGTGKTDLWVTAEQENLFRTGFRSPFAPRGCESPPPALRPAVGYTEMDARTSAGNSEEKEALAIKEADTP